MCVCQIYRVHTLWFLISFWLFSMRSRYARICSETSPYSARTPSHSEQFSSDSATDRPFVLYFFGRTTPSSSLVESSSFLLLFNKQKHLIQTECFRVVFKFDCFIPYLDRKHSWSRRISKMFCRLKLKNAFISSVVHSPSLRPRKVSCTWNGE